jgi:amidase/aspartyl-tRNA(Asn)/glutamyl-tRNA(Gln) amidotransferase subunit A
MDTAGWFTANAGDMLSAWKALTPGRANPPDEPSTFAQTTARPEDSPYPLNKFSDLRGCYLPMRTLLPDADPEIALACDAAAARLCPPADATTQTGLLESWRDALEAYVTIGMSEAHAVHHNWLAPYREHYDPVIWQRFSDAGHFPAEQIARARTIQKTIWASWHEFFFNYDYLVLPAVDRPAPRKADCTPELRRNILRLTAPASLGGQPVLSIPVSLPSGLTAGLQVILPVANSPVVPWVLSRS